MLNSYSLGSLLYLGPLILYIPHTEANNALGEMCALFLSQLDGKKELSQVWVRGLVDPGEAFCEVVLVLTRPETQAHWRTREAHRFREEPSKR